MIQTTMDLERGVGWTGDQEKIEGFQNKERIKDTVLYTQLIISHFQFVIYFVNISRL